MEKRGPRRKNGEGSFRIHRGKWNYRISYRDEFNEYKTKSFTAVTQEECLEKAEAFLIKVEKHKSGINPEASISELLRDKFEMSYQKNYTGESGYYRNMNTLKFIEKHPIAFVPIAEITVGQMELFLQSITGYSESNINKIYQQFQYALIV